MRRLLWVLVGLCTLWCAWWGFGAYGVYSGLNSWFEDRRSQGWQAEVMDVKMTGFPTDFTATLPKVRLADPDGGLAISLEQVQLSLRALWPGDIQMTLPDDPIQIATPDARWSLHTVNGVADLNMHPGAQLELENMSFAAGRFEILTQSGITVMGGDALTKSMTQQNRPNVYALQFDAQGFTPGARVRELLAVAPDWPPVFQTLTADILVEFDSAIDRKTWEDQRPQPQTIQLKRVEAQWGAMRLLAAGDLVRDARGYAQGDLTIKAENWQKMLDLATASGVLPQTYRLQAETMLGALARSTGNTNNLDITISFEGGIARFGFFPIGRAPSLIIR